MKDFIRVKLLFCFLLVSQVGQARGMPPSELPPSGINEKIVEKARYAVEQAAPDDWYTLAQSAQKCIQKGINLKEAVVWLNESLRIKRTPYNLEIQGDYFAKNRLPLKAIHAYAESFRRALLKRADYRSNISYKIKEQVMKLGKSYDGNLEALFPNDLSHIRTGTKLRELLGHVR